MIIRTIKQTVLLAAFVGLLGACAKQGAPDIPESRLFATPEAAVDAFIAALEKKDKPALMALFGPEGDKLLSSGDAVADAADRDDFLQSYKDKHAIVAEDDLRILNVGANDWPLPIPLASQDGKWYFDTAAGAEELINRRIGENELGAISAAHGFVEAQIEYASVGRDGDEAGVYAVKIVSDPGSQNGLYWETAEGEPESPIGAFVAAAAAEGYDAATADAYHGYRYRMLYKQSDKAAGGAKEYFNNGRLTDGFALLAWPAEYGASGMKTFMVNQDGAVFEKDLGPETDAAVSAINSFDPGDGWIEVREVTIAE
jgi:Protein of unknown function (DUF2950)